jgi:tetratricopeptide (TPR) repeat protein
VGEIQLALDNARQQLEILGTLAEPDSFTHVSARDRYAMALLAARRAEQALGELTLTADGYRRARPGSKFLFSVEIARALALGCTGRVKEGRSEVERVLAALPAEPEAPLHRALHVRGVLERMDGEGRAGLASQKAALEAVQPDAKAAYNRLPILAEIGLGHLELGDPGQAAAALDEALAQFEAHQRRTTPPHADALVGLGRARLAQGKAADALPSLEQADRFWREFDAESRWAGEAALWLGRCYAALGRAAEARTALDRAERVLSRSPLPADARLVKLARAG